MARPIELVCYTAGLLDGDGYITWSREGRSKRGKGNPFMGITQSSVNDGQVLLQQIRDEWGMGVVYTQRRVTNLGIDSTMYNWMVSGRMAVTDVLSELEPHLRVKSQKAAETLQRIRDIGIWHQYWSAAEDEFLRANIGILPFKEIGVRLGRNTSSQSVRERAIRLGIHTPVPNRRRRKEVPGSPAA